MKKSQQKEFLMFLPCFVGTIPTPIFLRGST